MTSKIEWTEQTWNPIIGCSKISEGCENCYAEKMAARLSRIESTEYYREVVAACGHWNGKTMFIPPQLSKPSKRKKPTIYFVGSMTDMFHPSVNEDWLDQIFDVISRCPQHRFIILTKRPERMREYMLSCQRGAEEFNAIFPWSNVILGVTAENQEQADTRIPILLDTPAAARFVSIEPMLGPVDLQCIQPAGKNYYIRSLDGFECDDIDLYVTDKINWVICGGESGPGARPMHPDWARGLRDQCAIAEVPFFFKQWGEYVPNGHPSALGAGAVSGVFWDGRFLAGRGNIDPTGHPEHVNMFRVGKKSAGNILDWQRHEEYPEILREVQDV